MNRRLQLLACTCALAVYGALSIDAQVSGVFFNEGWESGTLTQSFNSTSYGSAGPPQFSVSSQIFAPGGSRSIRHRLSAGMTGDDVQYATQHFGDATSGPRVAPGQHFYDLYVQYKTYYQNWNTTYPDGLTKGIEMGTEDGRIHNEVCCNPGFANYMSVYPSFGQDWNIEMVNKEGPNPNWILFRQNSSGYGPGNVFRTQNGRWYTIEVRRKLNDPGVDNGIVQMWVDGVLLINYNNVRFRVPRNGNFGVDFTFGTNWVMLSEYGPSDRDESVYYDDFKLSTSYIGTGGAVPSAPTNLRIVPSS